MRERIERWIIRARLRLGSWVLGGGWYGVVSRLWLIRERAMRAVNKDGLVVLAECQPLADALYEPLPGRWTLNLKLDKPIAVAGAPGPEEP